MDWYLGALWKRRLISSIPKRHQHCNWAKNWTKWILLSLTTDYLSFTSLSHPIFTFVIIVLFCFPSRLFLHDDVHEGLNDVRRKAVEDMKKLREKSGTLKGWFQVRFLWHDHVTFSLLLIVTSKWEIIFQPKCLLVYQRKQSSVKTVFNAKAMTGNRAGSCRHRVHHWIESLFLILKLSFNIFSSLQRKVKLPRGKCWQNRNR